MRLAGEQSPDPSFAFVSARAEDSLLATQRSLDIRVDGIPGNNVPGPDAPQVRADFLYGRSRARLRHARQRAEPAQRPGQKTRSAAERVRETRRVRDHQGQLSGEMSGGLLAPRASAGPCPFARER